LMGLSYNGSLDSDVHFARIKRMGGRTREIWGIFMYTVKMNSFETLVR
jgi:hypothetical protein